MRSETTIFANGAFEVADDVLQKVVRHGARSADVLDLQRDGIRLVDAHPDRKDLLPLGVAQQDDRHVGDRVDHQPFDCHFDLHGPVLTLGLDTSSVKVKCFSGKTVRARRA